MWSDHVTVLSALPPRENLFDNRLRSRCTRVGSKSNLLLAQPHRWKRWPTGCCGGNGGTDGKSGSSAALLTPGTCCRRGAVSGRAKMRLGKQAHGHATCALEAASEDILVVGDAAKA